MGSLFRDHAFILAIIAASQGQSQGNAIHLELICQVAEYESLIVRHEHVFGVDEEDKVRRTHSRLDQVVYLQGVVVVFGQTL